MFAGIGIAVAAQIAVCAPAVADPVVAPAVTGFVPLPDQDQAFYNPAAAVVASKAPGEIIAARQVNLGALNIIPINVDAWQVSYRSNNARGQAVPAVTTLIKPRGSTKDGGPRPLLSFQMAVDSLGSYCAPSYVMQQGALPWVLTGAATSGAQVAEVEAALVQGWAVAVPDHQGLDSAFAYGPTAGRITLDGIRAAENFSLLGLNGRATKVGLTGYSGGSIPTGHAAELHKTYAPDLNIVGASMGGVAADLGALVDLANNQLGAGVVASGMIGASREDPALAAYLDQHLNPLGRALFAAKGNLCLVWNSALAPFLNIKGLVDVPGDPLLDPIAKKALAPTKMGRTVPDMPMNIYQSNPDWLVPVGPVNRLVDTYCQDPNASVRYTRDHFSEHISLEVESVPMSLMWLRDRFAGVPAQHGCSTTDVGSVMLNQQTWPEWVHIVGEGLAGLFGKPLGA